MCTLREGVKAMFDVHRALRHNIISIVESTRCTNVSNYFILEWHSTCFGRSFRLSTGVQDSTYSNRHLSNRYCCLSGKYLLLYVQSWSPFDGRKDRPKHVHCHSKINKFNTLVHLVGFTIEILRQCSFLPVACHQLAINSAVKIHLAGLFGTASHADMQKIRVIGFIFENRLHRHCDVETNF